MIDKKGEQNWKNLWWIVRTSELTGRNYLSILKRTFQKQGRHVKGLQWRIDQEVGDDQKSALHQLFTSVVISCDKVQNIALYYLVPHEVSDYVAILSKLHKQNKLGYLTSLTLTTEQPETGIGNKEMQSLIKAGIPLKSLYIDEFHPGNNGELLDSCVLEQLLQAYSSSLVNLSLAKFYLGPESLSSSLRIKFPLMASLKSLEIATHLETNGVKPQFDSIRIDFVSESFPKLENLLLGYYTIVDEIPYSFIKKLQKFYGLTSWNWSCKFPTMPTATSSNKSKVKELYLPQTLGDPSFIPKVMEFFPNLKYIYLDGVSQAVLHAFFKTFSSSCLQELELLFEFMFPNMIESCLFPVKFQNNMSEATKKTLEALNKYKWREEYCKQFNIQCPLENSKDSKHFEGLSGLKKLKKFSLHYDDGRGQIHLPIETEERRWDDPLCQFSDEIKLGFDIEAKYPFSMDCYDEILSLSLQEFTWTGLPCLTDLKSPSNGDKTGSKK